MNAQEEMEKDAAELAYAMKDTYSAVLTGFNSPAQVKAFLKWLDTVALEENDTVDKLNVELHPNFHIETIWLKEPVNNLFAGTVIHADVSIYEKTQNVICGD